jgi:hypothetical protein
MHTSGGIRSGERQHRDILERQHSRLILCFGYLNQHQRLHNQCSFWASRVAQGLRHCIAVLEASLQPRVRSQSVSQPTVTSWLWSTVVWYFLRHIGAAGFRVKRAVCQEAVRLGRVVLRRTLGSQPSHFRFHTGVAAMGQDCTTNWISRKRGTSTQKKFLLTWVDAQ